MATATLTPPAEPRLLDRLTREARRRRLSLRTEQAYRQWTRRFVLFHGRRHPSELGPDAVAEFLTSLAVEQNVSASTQNQALAALLFLYRDVLAIELGPLPEMARATARSMRRPAKALLVASRSSTSK